MYRESIKRQLANAFSIKRRKLDVCFSFLFQSDASFRQKAIVVDLYVRIVVIFLGRTTRYGRRPTFFAEFSLDKSYIYNAYAVVKLLLFR